MTMRLALAVLGALLVAALPGTSAQAPLPSDPAGVDAALACASSAPPCGYIVPQISLDFPEKPPCRAQTLGGPIDLASCLTLPAVGDTLVQNGVMRFSWDVTQDGDYPQDPACTVPGTPCITITFSGTATNPKWMKLDVEPPQVVLDSVAFVHPDNFIIDQETQQVIFMVEVPLTVTFERLDEGTDAKSVQRIERAQGATQMFLKAKSSASGQYFKEAFGVEEFRFDPCTNGDALSAAVNQCAGVAGTGGASSEDAPGLGWLAPVAVLGTLAVALRRRRA